MKVAVYVDVVFIINFATDLFVLWITGIFMHQRVKLKRLLFGAFFGAASILPFLYYPYLLMGNTGVAIITGISMGTIAISFGGRNGGFIKKWFLSTTILFLLGGSMYCLKVIMGWNVLSLYKWIFLFGAGLACIFLLYWVKESSAQAEAIYFIKIIRADKIVFIHAYMDTGNLLWDALYQKPVILLSEEAAKKCLNGEEQLFLEQALKQQTFHYDSIINTNTQMNSGFHRVRYQSVGMENGWLVCFLADEVWLNETCCLYRQPVAVAPAFLFHGKEYQGLLHKACI